MKWQTFKIIAINNRNKYDSAIATGTDNTTDPVITNDPNNYLAPRIDEISVIQWLLIAFLFLSVIKQSKTL
jgi:hypothetical protein